MPATNVPFANAISLAGIRAVQSQSSHPRHALPWASVYGRSNVLSYRPFSEPEHRVCVHYDNSIISCGAWQLDDAPNITVPTYASRRAAQKNATEGSSTDQPGSNYIR